jgi:hypothetical protein
VHDESARRKKKVLRKESKIGGAKLTAGQRSAVVVPAVVARGAVVEHGVV